MAPVRGTFPLPPGAPHATFIEYRAVLGGQVRPRSAFNPRSLGENQEPISDSSAHSLTPLPKLAHRPAIPV